jgi:hypothetical protein
MKKIRDRLCKFSGEDYLIIDKCNDQNIKFIFSLIGAFVLVILISCFISAFLFTESLFDNPVQDFGIAIIWGLIITNLYVLLLYTISPTILPATKGKINKIVSSKTSLINISFILRIGLLILLAMIIAQPINVYFFSIPNNTYASAIKSLLSTNIFAWIVTLIVIIIFLLPAYWKYRIRHLGEFYKIKAAIEKRIIEDDYIVFKQKYKILLENNIALYNEISRNNIMKYLYKLENINSEKHDFILAEISAELKHESINKYEYWADPPYRTIRINQVKSALTEKDFINNVCNN